LGPDVQDVIVRGKPTIFNEASQSFIFAPIFLDEQPIGLLSVWSNRYAAYGERHARLLGEIASHAAQAIRNARLYDAERRRARQLGGLALTARVLSSSLEQPEAMRTAAANICSYLDATSVVITRVHSGSLRVFAAHGLEVAQLSTYAGWTTKGPGAWIVDSR
jgi:GAF domain-containing protein